LFLRRSLPTVESTTSVDDDDDAQGATMHYGLKAARGLLETHDLSIAVSSAATAAERLHLPFAADARQYALDLRTIVDHQRRDVATALRGGSATIGERTEIRRILTRMRIVLN
jgi:hypothetical protein